MHKDSLIGTLTVAAILCIVCSIFVSTASVKLRPIQKKNKLLDLKKNILIAAGMYEEGIDIEQAFNKIDARLVDFDSGEYVEGDVTTFDQRKSAKNPATNYRIPADQDFADIKVRSKIAPVYLVKTASGELESVILPMHGLGLWSVMCGFLAIEGDLNTVKGITFYQHGETPGLGGEIDNPKWKAIWPGKKIRNEDGELALTVIKGAVVSSSPNAGYQVDGMAGATITSRGVANLVKYWLGKNGFGNYLDKLAAGGS